MLLPTAENAAALPEDDPDNSEDDDQDIKTWLAEINEAPEGEFDDISKLSTILMMMSSRMQYL